MRVGGVFSMIEDLVHFSVNLRLLKQTGLECEICVYSHPTVSSNLAVWITQYTYCESVWMECTTRPWQAGCGKFTRRLSQMVFTRVSILMHVLTMINLSRCGTACKPTHISSNFFQTPVTAIILVFFKPKRSYKVPVFNWALLTLLCECLCRHVF